MTQDDIVQRLWKLCEVLLDDGIHCSDGVTELVSLLFVKMEYERVQNHTSFEHKLPDGCCLEPVLSLA
jgi:type I restriction enzyme M protein